MSEAQNIILIVDDTPTNIQLLNSMLREQYKVKAATSGEKALKIARTEPQPDIILLDIMMPEMDGYEVCRQLKSSPLTADIPVIFITAKTAVEDEQLGFSLGSVDYITKPFNPDIVKTRVKTQLEIYHQQRKLHEENKHLKRRVSNEFSDYIEPEIVSILEMGEGDGTEFKSTLRWNLHTDKADKKIENACLKTVAAFLNSDSGVLLVGVDDSGEVLGLEQDGFANEDKLLLHWNSLLKAHVGIEFMQLIRSQVNGLGGKRVLLVQCLRSSKPVFFRRDNDEIFYVRTGNGSNQLKPSEVIAYLDQRESQ
ncbi:MAG: response regulator [Gammaproteobacteria bacterium]|jgi:CheY-like chemotaxis protein|nr:response regulator [Gammaproteobacteria bacterium]MBT4145578.1 response regulator [Gammaproteobacteria bacterium]MBT5223212.1 response regulator [Gammaproteobacteria bacterium]MBT5824999.1 response regulator [Gammaproteobacteria bacterium]MBT5966850.1 response regulator [Gammaproteobacteria bacterium]